MKNQMNKKKPLARIWHPWTKWECYKAGFWGGPNSKRLPKKDGEEAYRQFFLSGKFEPALLSVLKEWKYSCEHNLTSPSLNKIAWGGQAAAAYELGIAAENRSGFKLLSVAEQQEQNELCKRLLMGWYEEGGYEYPKDL